MRKKLNLNFFEFKSIQKTEGCGIVLSSRDKELLKVMEDCLRKYLKAASEISQEAFDILSEYNGLLWSEISTQVEIIEKINKTQAFEETGDKGPDKDILAHDFERLEPIGNVERTDGVSSIEKMELLSGFERIEPASNFEKTEPIGNVERTDGVSSIEKMELLSGFERIEPASNFEKTEPIGNVERTDGVSSIEKMELLSGFERIEPASNFEKTEPIGNVERTDGVSSIEKMELLNGFERIEPVSDIEKTDPISSIERTEPTISFERMNPINDVPKYPEATQQENESKDKENSPFYIYDKVVKFMKMQKCDELQWVRTYTFKCNYEGIDDFQIKYFEHKDPIQQGKNYLMFGNPRQNYSIRKTKDDVVGDITECFEIILNLSQLFNICS